MNVRRLLGPMLLCATFASTLACGGASKEHVAGPAGVRDVVVVLRGGAEPLPFDPRGGRLTVVTQEIARLVGHPVVLELDTALSPELKATLEETVLASFETVVPELVRLQKEDPDMFAKASAIERVVCTYDATAKESKGGLEANGTVLVVRSPPDRFPLLERGVLIEAVYEAHVADLDARWGDVEPTRVPPREQSAYFAYMTKTRPGFGYLWVYNRAQARKASRDDLRAELVERIVKLAGVVEKKTPLSRKVNAFLLESAPVVGDLAGGASKVDRALARRVSTAYTAWLTRDAGGFDDPEKLLLERALFHRPFGSDDASRFEGFDRFAFGLAVYDAWSKEGARVDLPPGPRRELVDTVVCPVKKLAPNLPDSEREIRYGCSRFFAYVLGDEKARVRLAATIDARRDMKLLETALMNLGHQQGREALALVESLRDETSFRRGVAILFHELARRDDVKSALEQAAPRWWRDTPSRRGLALLVMARRHEHLHLHYSDNQWSRFVSEFGGRIQRDVFAAYLAEGPRAIEMAPKIWPALEKTPERDQLVAQSLHVLLRLDLEARSSRSRNVLVLLRSRLCEETNAAGLAAVRAAIAQWRAEHPEDAAAVSNALVDFTPERCAKPSESASDG